MTTLPAPNAAMGLLPIPTAKLLEQYADDCHADGATDLSTIMREGAAVIRQLADELATLRQALAQQEAVAWTTQFYIDCMNRGAAAYLWKSQEMAGIHGPANIPLFTAPVAQGQGEELILRRLLAIRYAGVGLYTDDGELQDGTVHPCIDFLRDAPSVIERKIHQRGRAAAEAAGYAYFGEAKLAHPAPVAHSPAGVVTDEVANDVLTRYLENSPAEGYWPPERARELRIAVMRAAITAALKPATGSEAHSNE